MEGLLVTLLIFVLIAGVIYWIITLIPFPQPFKNIALAILGIIAVIWLIGLMTGVVPRFQVR
jgi:hypothetical protein